MFQAIADLPARSAAWGAHQYLSALAAADDERGQATVEYVGLTVVLGTGIGLIVAGLDGLGFAAKIGGKLIGGVTKALDKII